MAITSFSGKYAFLSNFYPCPIEFEGAPYPTVEHAFQAAKTTDPHARRLIAGMATPGRAKYAGRRLPIRPDWDAVKIDVMRTCLAAKFSRADLREKLQATAPADLVEGNTWGDRFWGQCPVGTGENWLGRLLMEIRDGADR